VGVRVRVRAGVRVEECKESYAREPKPHTER
jgi:hypothetical protein